MKNCFLLAVLFLAAPVFLTAQRGWEAGPWAGVSHYFGDLNTNYTLSRPGFAAGLGARFNFNERVCIKFSGTYGSVSGDDALSKNIFERSRNLNFESVILDGAAVLEFNFLPYRHGSRDEFFSPYIFGGMNVFYFNPKTELDGETYELRGFGTEGQFKGEEYYTVHAGLAYGIGFKIDLSYEWSLNFELGSRYLFTDYLDDVSTVYPDKSDLLRNRGEIAVELSDRSIPLPGAEEGQIGKEGSQRGDSSINDSYVFLGVGLMYYFGDLKCPDYGSRKRRN